MWCCKGRIDHKRQIRVVGNRRYGFKVEHFNLDLPALRRRQTGFRLNGIADRFMVARSTKVAVIPNRGSVY